MSSIGYIAVNKETGKLVVMVEYGFSKIYAQCDIADAKDVVDGKRPNCALRSSGRG